MNDNELLSIKKFSKLTGIKGSTLRYYDDLGLFTPADRGDNNYRYYQPQQLITIKAIELLHELDMPIKEIVEIEKNRSPQSVSEALGKKERELKSELDRLQRSYDVVHTIRNLISSGLSSDECQIYLLTLDEMRMTIGPDNDFKDADNFYEAFLNFCADATNRDIDLRFPVGGLYASFDTFLEHPSQPSQFFSYDPKGKDIREAGTYLTGYARGYYGQISDVQDRMLEYAQEHGLTIAGPLTVTYVHGEICMKDPNQYLCEIQVQVECEGC